MNEAKLRDAFSRIKEDMNYLSKEISSLKKANTLSSEIKKDIGEIKKFNLDKFTKEMRDEFKLINAITEDFNKKYVQNSRDIQEFNKQLDRYNDRIEEIKSKVVKEHNETENVHLDMNLLETKFSEFQEMLNEKISLEIASLKLELTDDMVRLSQEVKAVSTSQSAAINIENSLTDLNEMINEKIDMEIGAIKLEFTNEIAKTYDKFFNEISKSNKKIEKVENNSDKKKTTIKKVPKKKKESKPKKQTVNSKKSNTKIKTEVLEMPPEEKKEGRFKKVAKWLFVDDEEGEIDNIKSEVKKGNK